jgi:hypothetical protein
MRTTSGEKEDYFMRAIIEAGGFFSDLDPTVSADSNPAVPTQTVETAYKHLRGFNPDSVHDVEAGAVVEDNSDLIQSERMVWHGQTLHEVDDDDDEPNQAGRRGSNNTAVYPSP